MHASYIGLKECDSTNNEIKRRLSDGRLPEFTVVSADTQTAGRGRSGHEWNSPPGVSVSSSMVLYPKGLDPKVLPRLTPLAALAVCGAVEELCPLSATIKWPNDVLVHEKKVCGILTELLFTHGEPTVIVGIGINVHTKEFPPEIKDTATSLDRELSETEPVHISRQALTQRMWERFLKEYDRFRTQPDLSAVRLEYDRRLINRGRTVTVLDPKGTFSGRASGIDETGRLLVETVDGIRAVNAGEVSVRGIGGYV